jgi:hypothetical protein
MCQRAPHRKASPTPFDAGLRKNIREFFRRHPERVRDRTRTISARAADDVLDYRRRQQVVRLCRHDTLCRQVTIDYVGRRRGMQKDMAARLGVSRQWLTALIRGLIRSLST